MQHIDADFIHTIDGLLQESVRRLSLDLRPILSALVARGASSARHYQLISAPTNTTDRHLVLTGSVYQDTTKSPPIGYRIAYDDSTLFKSGQVDRSAVGTAYGISADEAGWIGELHLEGQSWIDCKITNGETEDVGLLAVAWHGPKDLLTVESRHALQVICRLISLYQEKIYRSLVQTIGGSVATRLAKATNGQHRNNELPKEIAELVGDALRAKATAVFRYLWVDDRLEKVAEVIHNHPSADVFHEAYAAEEYLTGKAWRRIELRHVPDFATHSTREGADVSADSVARHTKLFGSINSLLYATVGTHRDRYLIRLMNRSDVPGVPFTDAEARLLDQICERITRIIDARSVETILNDLESSAISGLRGIDKVERILTSLQARLERFDIERYIFLNWKTASDTITGERSDGDIATHFSMRGVPSSTLNDAPMISVGTGSLASELSGRGPFSVFDLGSFSVDKSDALAEGLKSIDCPAVLTINAGYAQSHTTLIVPLAKRHRRPLRLDQRLSELEQRALFAVLAICSASLDASALNVSAEKADLVISYFGHEVGTPITKMGQLAIAGINRAMAILQESLVPNRDALADLLAKKGRVDTQSQYVRRQIDVAVAMAEQSKGIVQVDFRKFGWFELTREAWDDALSWARLGEGRMSQRAIIVRSNDAIKSMKGTGDAFYLRAALSNLLKNAIKYSMPRFGDEPMIVEVLGQPQLGWDVVQVRNWGAGIPESERKRIFEKYGRVERMDRVRGRGIPGAGLGLYLARTFASFHKGIVMCRDSISTLDDPVRIARGEGFETTFELRIPQNLPIGKRMAAVTA